MTQNHRRTWQRWRTIWSIHIHIKHRKTDRTKLIERRLLTSCAAAAACVHSRSMTCERYCALCMIVTFAVAMQLIDWVSDMPIDSVATFTKTFYTPELTAFNCLSNLWQLGTDEQLSRTIARCPDYFIFHQNISVLTAFYLSTTLLKLASLQQCQTATLVDSKILAIGL